MNTEYILEDTAIKPAHMITQSAMTVCCTDGTRLYLRVNLRGNLNKGKFRREWKV